MLCLERICPICAPKLRDGEIVTRIDRDLESWVICGNVTARYHSEIESAFFMYVCSRIGPKVDQCLEIR